MLLYPSITNFFVSIYLPSFLLQIHKPQKPKNTKKNYIKTNKPGISLMTKKRRM